MSFQRVYASRSFLQCVPGACARMRERYGLVARAPEDEAWMHKFVMIMDGNTFSSRLMQVCLLVVLAQRESSCGRGTSPMLHSLIISCFDMLEMPFSYATI